MRCPKCHYISFESADRCRNCGYDFSLAAGATEPPPELVLNDRDEAPLAPIDLSLSQVDGLDDRRVAESEPFDIEQIHGPGTATPVDLPLFKSGSASPEVPADPARPPRAAGGLAARRHDDAAADADAPLIRPSALPRAPIAVRRPTPDAQRHRARYAPSDVPRLNLGAPFEEEEEAEALPVPVNAHDTAPAGRRVLAALIDVAILGGINLAVVYFTLRLCALPLSMSGLLELPAVPLVAFLLLLDGGYAVGFTAAIGQTIGKMAAGLRVVHVDEDQSGDEERPSFGFAVLRTAAYAASVLPAGMGFLPALIGKDRRALHDRLAETRVIRL